jgi:predicted Fe-S protein YdhL (DUF1289 family)
VSASAGHFAEHAPIVSPCTNVCEMDAATGLCRGCFRTLGEIAAWGALDDDARRAVMAELPGRRARVEPAGTR